MAINWALRILITEKEKQSKAWSNIFYYLFWMIQKEDAVYFKDLIVYSFSNLFEGVSIKSFESKL